MEDCDYIEECLQVKNKVGVGFCKDKNWRGIVVGHLRSESFSGEKLYSEVPGLDLAIDEVKTRILSEIDKL